MLLISIPDAPCHRRLLHIRKLRKTTDVIKKLRSVTVPFKGKASLSTTSNFVKALSSIWIFLYAPLARSTRMLWLLAFIY